jgi:3'-5' exoribonuclease
MFARFVNEFVDGARVAGTFTLRSREVRSSRNGEAYLAVELGDRTGLIPGVLFRPDAVATSIPSGSVVRVQGTVTTFRGVRRVSMHAMRPAESWDSADLIASSQVPIEEMVSELREIVASVSHPGLKRLLRAVLGDRPAFERFCACPASQHHHHAYVGGLLAHTISVARICELCAARYDDIDRDLLITAAVMHDFGKIDEISVNSGIGFTDEGRLIGHVVSGLVRLRDAGAKSRLDQDTLLRLEHAVLSHHGELEWGSPKKPSTIEALVLHHADNMDAKTSAFTGMLRGAMLANEVWTDAGNLFRRPLFAPRALEDEQLLAGEGVSADRLSA